uniref:Digestive organ expansion factor-like protein n=1 Tax=Noccaea caerulescens TaxID=107243 RepID=A0A1J3JND1_NOCCA
MAPNFTGVLKRHRPQERIDRKRDMNKSKRFFPNPATEDHLDSSVEEESTAMAYREPTTYDDLLASLGSSNKVVADINRRRKREEEGKSDTESDEDDEDEENIGSEDQSSTYGEDDEIQGADQESLLKYDDHSEQENSEYCETDEEHELSTNGQSLVAVSSSSTSSAFSEHLSHTLSCEEVETLPKGNWKFKWEAPAIGMPHCTWKGTRPDFLHVAHSDATYGIKPKLFKHWLQLYEKAGGEDFESSTRRRFFSLCNRYLDILHSNKRPFYNRGIGEDLSHMDAYLMHSLNHIFRTRDLVKKNESKIAKLSPAEILSDDGLRDQGFTRPKVLILLPLRSIAFRVVNRLIQLTPETLRVNVEHPRNFIYNFGCEDGSENDDHKKRSKPCDWQALFGEGNSDDDFMLGIKHTRKSIRLYDALDNPRKNIRLYDDFYSSDMIIASPMGLLLAIADAEENKERDVDYLSSIEILVIDHADVMSMQNWAHVALVVEQLNGLPSKQHGTDIKRIRPLYLDGHARFYRQSIILSSYLTPEINSLFNHHCLNYKGKMQLEHEYKGVLSKVVHSVDQIYERFDADSMIQVDHARLECFTNKIFPKIKDSVQGGVMIFVSSYFELVMLKMFLMSQKASFCVFDEHSNHKVKIRARQEFIAGSKKIMLYSERVYFLLGCNKIRGIKKLIMYSLPERKEYYPRIMNWIEESHDMESTVLYSRFDQFRLERIVGHANAKRMISKEKSTYVFR